jgi:Kdo2-lipid IVA lauroyltransferase/acyltransferase
MKLKISVFFQSRANVFLFRHMSPRVAQHYLHAIGFLYYSLFNRGEKRVIEKNVRDVLRGQDEKYIRRVVRESFKGIFTHYFEKLFSGYLDYATVCSYVQRHFTVEGADLLGKALEQGKGCILVTAHWGAVEFIPWVLLTRGIPSSIILECATAKLARNLEDKATHGDMKFISSEQGGSVFLRAMQSLKANRILMTQCDEVDAWRRRRSQTIRLLGKELFFDSTIDILSHRSGAPVVSAFLKRSGNGKYTLFLEDVSVRRTSQGVARDCLGIWERYVSQYPEQWYQWKKWGAMKTA